MKHIAAYLLAQLTTEAPSKEDVSKILASVGSEANTELLGKLFAELDGKNVSEVRARAEGISDGLSLWDWTICPLIYPLGGSVPWDDLCADLGDLGKISFRSPQANPAP